MMKIGVISDTHIPERARSLPRKILDEFKKMDMVIHAGDLAEASVLEALKKVCANVVAVRGNMDSDEIKAGLAEKEIARAGKYKIGVVHGWGHPDRITEVVGEVFRDNAVDVIVFGHSHRALNEKKGGVLYFNPGSPTDTYFAPFKSYGILEINDKIEAKIIKI